MLAKAWRLALLLSLPLILTACTIPFKEKLLEIKQKNQPTEIVDSSSGAPTEAVTMEEKEIEKLFKVTRILDGDTVELENGKKVRLIGIDAPEKIDCLYQKSTEKLKRLTLNKLVRLEKDVSETDRFGRLLRYVYLDSIFVNEQMVKEGYANSYTYPPDTKYQQRIVSAQKYAQENNLGLWEECRSQGQPRQGEVQGVKDTKVVEKTPATTSLPASTSPPAAVSTTTPPSLTTTPPTQTSPQTQSSPTNQTTSQSSTAQTAHVYYTSSSSRAKYYYCDTDSGWKGLSEKNLRSFNSVEELLKEFPTRVPHRDPVC